MLRQLFRWSTVVLLFAVVAPLAFATLPTPVSVEAELTADGALQLRVTAHTDRLRAATLLVRSGGAVASFPLTLPPGTPVPVTLADATGEVIVRLVGHQGDPIFADTFHVERAGRAARLVPHEERRAAGAAAKKAEATSELERRMRRIIAQQLARGGRPALNTLDDPDDPAVQLWNALVEQMRKEKKRSDVTIALAPGEDCPPWIPSSYNYFYPVRGTFGYYDTFQEVWRRPFETGFRVRIATLVEYEDQCGEYMLRRRYYYADSGQNGSFYFSSVQTIDAPNTINPVDEFAVTAPDVGLRNGSTMTTIAQTLPPSQHNYYWSSAGEAVIDPFFTESFGNRPSFFRWNEQIKRLKRYWQGEGFSSYYTPFRAAWESIGNGAYFHQTSPGMVVFGDSRRWSPKFLMAHEFGHQLHYRLQGDAPIWTNGDVHSMCQVNDAATAFAEGFANWAGVYMEWEGAFSFGIDCYQGECQVPCTNGYRKEGNVMAYLWDIFDASNHATKDNGIDHVWFRTTILRDHWRWGANYSSFPDWWTDFRNKNAWGIYEFDTENLKPVNKVHVPEPE